MKAGLLLSGAIALVGASSASAVTPMLRAADIRPGVDVHANAYGSPAREVAALRALGIQRVRLDAPHSGALKASDGYTTLCAAGIRITPFFNGWIGEGDDADPHAEFSATKTLERRYPGCIEAIEGPNEVNNFPEHYAGLTGSAGAQAFMNALVTRVRGDAVLGHIPTIDYTDVHPIDGPGDIANAHPYVGSWWQDYAIAQTAPRMPKTKPWAATEYGWATPPTLNERSVTEAVQAQRIVAGVCAMAAAGFNPAFIYELRDEGGSTTDNEQHFGLFRTDWTPKPAAIYLSRLMYALRDDGKYAASFTPKPFSVSIDDPKAKSVLVAKSDGSYILLVWFNKHLGEQPSAFTITFKSMVIVSIFRVEDGQVVSLGRRGSLANLQFTDTEAVVLLRLSTPH